MGRLTEKKKKTPLKAELGTWFRLMAAPTLAEHLVRRGYVALAESLGLYTVLHIFRVCERQAQRVLLAFTLMLSFSAVTTLSTMADRGVTAEIFSTTHAAIPMAFQVHTAAALLPSLSVAPSAARADLRAGAAGADLLSAPMAPTGRPATDAAAAGPPKSLALFDWLALPQLWPVAHSIGRMHIANLSVPSWAAGASVDDMMRTGQAILAANQEVVGFAICPEWGLQVYGAAGLPLKTGAGGWTAFLRATSRGALAPRTAPRDDVWDPHTSTTIVGEEASNVLWSCNGANACGATKQEMLQRAYAFAAIDPRAAVISIAACPSWYGFQVHGAAALRHLERKQPSEAGSWEVRVRRGAALQERGALLPTVPPTQPPTFRRLGAAPWSTAELLARGCDCEGQMEHPAEGGVAAALAQLPMARALTLTSREARLDDATHARFTRRFPGYSIQHYSDAEVRTQLAAWRETAALAALKKLRHGVSVADVFRLVAVYHRGGFYMDVKSGFKCGRDVRCVEMLAASARQKSQLGDAWFAAPAENWAFFGERNSSVLRYVIDAVVGDINACRAPTARKGSTDFDARVLAHTGPHAIERHLAAWQKANPHAPPARLAAEPACLTYDVRGALTSWTATGSYHLVPPGTSVYADGAC